MLVEQALPGLAARFEGSIETVCRAPYAGGKAAQGRVILAAGFRCETPSQAVSQVRESLESDQDLDSSLGVSAGTCMDPVLAAV